jgi:hypothetical protein
MPYFQIPNLSIWAPMKTYTLSIYGASKFILYDFAIGSGKLSMKLLFIREVMTLSEIRYTPATSKCKQITCGI